MTSVNMSEFRTIDERFSSISKSGRILKKSAKWIEAEESYILETNVARASPKSNMGDINDTLVSKCRSILSNSPSSGDSNDMSCDSSSEEKPENGVNCQKLQQSDCARVNSNSILFNHGSLKEECPYTLRRRDNGKKVIILYKYLSLTQDILKNAGKKQRRVASLKAIQRFNRLTSIDSDSVDSGDSECYVPPTRARKHSLSVAPVDVAAHLKLLGDNLTRTGLRIYQEGLTPNADGVYSSLLDSLLCSVGTFLCLSREIHGLENLTADSFTKTLDHIAYFFPFM